MELPKRKHIRLPSRVYSENGAYFITICAHDRACIFGEIAVGQGERRLVDPAVDSVPLPGASCRNGLPAVGQGLCSCRLSAIGELIREEIFNLEARYAHVHIDRFVIMPNHVHLLLLIKGERSEAARAEPLPYGSSPASIGDVVCAFKSITTKRANKMEYVTERKIWQFRFHDRIIRNENEHREIAAYIDNNPLNWELDRYYAAGKM